ncbi:MAG: DUF1127 domain-containing protein [Amylibacter sp.]
MAHALTHRKSILNDAQTTALSLCNTFVARLVLSTKRLQIAQLTQALNRMEPHHLADIGITRSEIPDYARICIRLHG